MEESTTTICVIKSLQKEGRTVSDARALFQEIFVHFSSIRHRLRDNANIFLPPEVERDVTKIQVHRFSELTEDGKKTLQKHRQPKSIEEIGGLVLSRSERAFKKRRVNNEDQCSYIDTRFFVAHQLLVKPSSQKQVSPWEIEGR